MSGLAVLSGLLGGLGGINKGLAEGTAADQRQQQIDLQRRQLEEGNSTDLTTLAPILKAAGMDVGATTGRVPNAVLPLLVTAQQKKDELARKAQIGQDISRQLLEQGTTTGMAPGASLEMPQPGALMAPPAATPMPEITQRRVDPKMAALAKLVPGLLQTDPAAATALLKDQFATPKPMALSDTQTLVDPRTGAPIGPARPTLPVPPGMVPKSFKQGGTTYETPGGGKSNLSQGVEDILQAQGINPLNATAAQIADAREQSVQDQVRIFSAKNQAAIENRPLDASDKTAIAAHNNILASTELFKQFKPEEITQYVGLINRPMADVKQALAATFGMGKADQRYADFKALMGRLQGTAFGEGGKQLTGLELSIVQLYTPTGREPGGAAEIMAKLKNLEAFTRISRATRIKMAQTGRAELDPDAFDAELRVEMKRAGLGGAETTPPGAIPPPGAAGGQGTVRVIAPDGRPGTWDLSRGPIPPGFKQAQ